MFSRGRSKHERWGYDSLSSECSNGSPSSFYDVVLSTTGLSSYAPSTSVTADASTIIKVVPMPPCPRIILVRCFLAPRWCGGGGRVLMVGSRWCRMSCGAGASVKPAPLVDPSLLTYWACASTVYLSFTPPPSAIYEPDASTAIH